MSNVIVSNIRLRTRDSIIKFEHDPAACPHAWELHCWEHGDAYCPLCGSLATAENDPRVDRSGGHVRYVATDEHSVNCPGCGKQAP